MASIHGSFYVTTSKDNTIIVLPDENNYLSMIKISRELSVTIRNVKPNSHLCLIIN